MKDITAMLNAVEQGDPLAAQDLIPAVYEQLRALARHKLAHERPGQTLQPTALVHEAYLRVTNDDGQVWQGRRHFFAAAAEAMRRILVENARRKASQKHGGEWERVDWNDVQLAAETGDDRLLALNEALGKLQEKDETAATLIKLRFFVGLTGQEAAQALDLPERTATRTWAYARAWLLKEIQQTIGEE